MEKGPWGEAVRALRGGMSQRKLAAAAGMSPTTLGRIERGGHTQTKKLEAIARALNVPIRQVLIPDSPREGDVLSVDDRRAIEAMKTLLRSFSAPPKPSEEQTRSAPQTAHR